MNIKLLLAGLIMAAPCAVPAQSFSVNWFTIDGGGGVSTGGVYALSGTIGQPDASGPLTGGSFTLIGGFWGLSSVAQTPGAPPLSIEYLGGGLARIYWPRPADGFLLEAAPAFASPPAAMAWNPTPLSYQTNATQISVTAPATGRQVFRLHHP
jgi:hypothetical protein